MQPEAREARKTGGRVAAGLIGVLLLAHLVHRAGPSKILEGIASVGWGLALVIAVAGLALAVRTWAWRLTLTDSRNRPSFARMLCLRLASEAAGQAGAFGQIFGDTWRVANLGAELPLSGRIASVALDRALYTLVSTVVSVVGIASVAFLLPAGKARVLASLFGCGALAVLFLTMIAVRRRWALLSGPARALGRLRGIGGWVERRRETIQSVEDELLDFFHHSPSAFWGSLALQLAGHLGALLEVFLILRLMGCRTGVISALAIEGFTKLVNVIGLINPGNAGTYEGGNMLLTKLVGIGATAGLTLALIRRVRALFWAAVGAACAVALPASTRRNISKATNKAGAPAPQGHTAIILARGVPAESLLARVGALPVLLRAILGEHKAGAARIVVAVDVTAGHVREELRRTGRLPGDVEWFPAVDGEIVKIIHDIKASEDRIVLVAADRTYRPSLHRRAAEWDQPRVLALTTDGEPAGIYASHAPHAMALLDGSPSGTRTLGELREWLAASDAVVCEEVPSDDWQRVLKPEDRVKAEGKLEAWLFKPTDGLFARMNRRVSIPMSRQLIKFPITPNMVSLFTLGVSFMAGVFFALGGWGHMVIGAMLSVFASILDGCDGEVARLTFQDSAFGCWLETVCDYLYYVFLFAGMMIGLLARGPVYMIWGSVLFFGAVATFLTTAMQRRRMAGARPEQYLVLWQAQAARRSSNPLLSLGRHTEVLIKRCCMPYLVLACALFGATYMAFIGAAVGSNIAWLIVLYSYFTFSPARTAHE